MLYEEIMERWIKILPAKHKTPYIYIDTSIAVQKVRHLKELMPRVSIYYAVKSLNDEKLLNKIIPEVSGFDVASFGEVEQLYKLGVDPIDMYFSNPVKRPDHIKAAYELGVRYFAFDSLTEIDKLAEFAPGANVYLRLRVLDHGSMFPLSQKFGVDPVYAVAYCSTAKEKGLKPIGLAFHVGSQSENAQAWSQAIEICRGTIKRLKNIGIETELLDMGGGFPADYGASMVSIDTLSVDVNAALDKFIPKDIRIISEPGRHISANTAVIVTSVIGGEQRQGRDWLYVDIGTFQGLIEPLEMSNWKYPLVNLELRGKDEINSSFVLTGPSCDACDTLGSDYLLPKKSKVGDRIMIGAAGAYTVVYETNFNGFSPPERLYVDSPKGEEK